MRAFLLQHLDSLISTAVGLFVSFVGFRAPAGQLRTKILRTCGPLVLAFGLFSFLSAERPPAPKWQRYKTSDGFASAQFPATPEAKQNTESDNGIAVETVSLVCDLPYTRISLHLSTSTIPPKLAGIPDADRYAGLKAFLSRQGFTVVSESTEPFGEASGFALHVQRHAGKVRVWTRIVYAAGKAYRVIASSEDPRDDVEIIKRFLESFRIEHE